MIRLGTKTRKDPTKVLDQAVEFFGPQGLGLEVRRRAADSVYFAGSIGHVQVTAIAENDSTDVDIESQEWEYDAKRFLEKI
jgi:hypothetical protein